MPLANASSVLWINLLRRQGCSGNSLGVCTDGATQINGFHFGVVARIKRIAHHDLIATHLWTLCFQIYGIISQSVKIVNFVKASATNLWMFFVVSE